MAARQIPPSAGQRGPASAIERAFERKVRLSKWALLFEQLWPRAWMVLGLAGVFIGASLAGLWPRLPELPHKIVLGYSGWRSPQPWWRSCGCARRPATRPFAASRRFRVSATVPHRPTRIR